jgi:hypothetical protein
MSFLVLAVLHSLMRFSIGTTGKMRRDSSSAGPLSSVPCPLSCRLESPRAARDRTQTPQQLANSLRSVNPVARKSPSLTGPRTVNGETPQGESGRASAAAPGKTWGAAHPSEACFGKPLRTGRPPRLPQINSGSCCGATASKNAVSNARAADRRRDSARRSYRSRLSS